MTSLNIDMERVRAIGLQAADREVARRALAMQRDIQEELSKPGSGQRYRRGRREHIASSPGDAPAVDTGRLRQSISAVKVTDGHWRVGTNLEYALLLEFGTRKIAPRPFMRPALARASARSSP